MPNVPRFVAGSDLPTQTAQPILRPDRNYGEIGAAAMQAGQELGRIGVQVAQTMGRKNAALGRSAALDLYVDTAKEYDEFEAQAKQGKVQIDGQDVTVNANNYAAVLEEKRRDLRKKALERAQGNNYMAQYFLAHWEPFELRNHDDALKHQNRMVIGSVKETWDKFADLQKKEILGEQTIGGAFERLDNTLKTADGLLKGLMPDDQLAKLKENYRNAVGGELARRNRDADPKGFVAGHYKAFEKYTDPKFLDTLIERGGAMARQQDHDDAVLLEKWEGVLQQIHKRKYRSDLAHLAGALNDPDLSKRPTLNDVQKFIEYYGEDIGSISEVNGLYSMVLGTKGENPILYNHYLVGLIQGRFSERDVMAHAGEIGGTGAAKLMHEANQLSGEKYRVYRSAPWSIGLAKINDHFKAKDPFNLAGGNDVAGLEHAITEYYRQAGGLDEKNWGQLPYIADKLIGQTKGDDTGSPPAASPGEKKLPDVQLPRGF